MTITSCKGGPTVGSGSASVLTFIDLFCGCGGFSLGLEWAGLKCLAAIDSNESAIRTFRENHPEVPAALAEDLTQFGPKDLDRHLGSQRIDVVVGGPPCQGFSRARQVDGANHGKRFVHDPRRELYKHFLRFVAYYQPSVFVMENVPDIKTVAFGRFFTQVQVESRELGYRIVPYEVRAWRFGVPQKRIRQLVIGTRRELPLFIPDKYIRPTHADLGAELFDGLEPAVTLWEAIGDLPPIEAGDQKFVRIYDEVARRAHINRYGRRYIYDVLQVHKAEVLTAHVARPHSARDLRDFCRLKEGETSRQAIARGVNMEFPYDRGKFRDRYTRQHRDQLCSTIVAHLKKDGLMFIHPTQPRSLSVREAARVQSFPDTFRFPEERTHSFEQIGNAVPPMVGKAVGLAINEFLEIAETSNRLAPRLGARLPRGRTAAIKKLEGFVQSLFMRNLSSLTKDEFLDAWWAVGYLHPHLHPDAALENGREISRGTRRGVSFVVEPVYIRSGWPVELIPIAQEARRRFEAGLLSEEEYYCSAAVMAGAAQKKMTK